MKISVIVPTYKPQDYLWECLSSISRQSFPLSDYEILIILNGCNEPYKEKIESFINERMDNSIVRLIQIDKPGVSNARNIALEVAKGNYITFLDDDDYVSYDYLSELYKVSSQETVGISNRKTFEDISNKGIITNIDVEFQKLSPNGKQNFLNACRFFSGPCQKLFHRTILEGRKFDERLKIGEDTLYMFLISNRLKYVNFTSSEAIYYRRMRCGSAITTKRPYFTNLRNNILEAYLMTSYYVKDIKSYNFKFYVKRISSAIISGVFNIQ